MLLVLALIGERSADRALFVPYPTKLVC